MQFSAMIRADSACTYVRRTQPQKILTRSPPAAWNKTPLYELTALIRQTDFSYLNKPAFLHIFGCQSARTGLRMQKSEPAQLQLSRFGKNNHSGYLTAGTDP